MFRRIIPLSDPRKPMCLGYLGGTLLLPGMSPVRVREPPPEQGHSLGRGSRYGGQLLRFQSRRSSRQR
jgi:hypothetical protein